MYGQVVNQFRRYMGHVSNNIGGVYEYYKTADQDGAVYIHVDKAHQKNCMDFIQKQLFETPEWLIDQEIFNTPPPPHQSQKTMDTWASMHRQNAVPYAEGTHWYSNVGHLVTYGAGYYGYLYSQVFANDIWTSLFKGHSLNRQSGELIWKKLLIHGGAKDANVMLHDLLGREPTAKHFLKGIS